MKRVIAACALLIFSFTVAFVSNYMITDKMNGISAKLRSLNEDLPSVTADELGKKTEEIVNEWESCEWLVHAFISTDSVVEAEASLKMLDELAKEGLTEEFEVYCIEAYSKVDSICNSERINKENIF